MFDIIIIGAGVNGAFIARNLSKYNLSILCIEKENDVGNGTSVANSAIIHSGYDPKPASLKARLNVLGNYMYDSVCQELDVEFSRIGSLTIATSDEEVETLHRLLDNAKENGVTAEIIDAKKLHEIEPFATKNAVAALHAKTAGIINPFELTVALMENAMDNGVILNLNEEVKKITKDANFFEIQTNRQTYQTKIIINAAGVYADKINNMVSPKGEKIVPRKGEYYVLDHNIAQYVTHTLFSLPTKAGKGVLISPTTHNNYLIGPSSIFVEDKDDVATNQDTLKSVLEQTKKLVDYVPMQYSIRQFAGLRAYHESDDFVINSPVQNFINVLGMASPGLASAPATALEVENMVLGMINCSLKDNYKSKRRPLYRFNKLSTDEKVELCKKDSMFGNIVCRCEVVTEAEVVDAIKRNCGATTIKGVKKRVRPGFGKCQGGFCEAKIIEILARELNKPLEKINKTNENSYILLGKLGEDNE